MDHAFIYFSRKFRDVRRDSDDIRWILFLFLGSLRTTELEHKVSIGKSVKIESGQMTAEVGMSACAKNTVCAC
jgi:hypothetical protein